MPIVSVSREDGDLTASGNVPGALAPYAASAAMGGERLHREVETPGRSAFGRDRDRIVHSQAFRRLAHKTQVFISEEGDHYRTRLTHTIEVAQIARSLARNLKVDADLTEALALAHDLGHTPFGHTGEDALSELMGPFGGFEHNAQTLRIVTHLEQRYAGFDGLNLSIEALDGIIKHNGPLLGADGEVLSEKLNGVLPFAVTDFLDRQPSARASIDLTQQASLEAQLAAISDDIAYNTHDIDDGVRAGFFALDDLRSIATLGTILNQIDEAHHGLPAERRMGEFTRRLITLLIMDVEAHARRRLTENGIETAAEVKRAGTPLALFSDEVAADIWLLRAFLFKTMYRNADIMALRAEAERVLRDLFGHLTASPDDLPDGWKVANTNADKNVHTRQVCDFIAGMTDRYALSLHGRWFDDTPDLRYGAPN
ncbi:MAG: deoxyguanosinetriphosphate triphosphohydrolase [Pseudomonadota bacterium]